MLQQVVHVDQSEPAAGKVAAESSLELACMTIIRGRLEVAFESIGGKVHESQTVVRVEGDRWGIAQGPCGHRWALFRGVNNKFVIDILWSV